jgi:hypothetical protein
VAERRVNQQKGLNQMIHFVCDVCKCEISPEQDLRYVVRMEVYAALDDGPGGIDEDRDHLEEIHEILERSDDNDLGNQQLGEHVYQQLRFDLCSECRKKFIRDPLGRRIVGHLDFSKN